MCDRIGLEDLSEPETIVCFSGRWLEEYELMDLPQVPLMPWENIGTQLQHTLNLRAVGDRGDTLTVWGQFSYGTGVTWELASRNDLWELASSSDY